MENRIANMSLEERRCGEPKRISDILAELLARYESRFPPAKIAVVQQMPIERGMGSPCPAELAVWG